MSDELHNNEPTEEPSVLDYVKSLFRFGGAERVSLPKFVEQESPAPVTSDRSTIAYLRALARFPWRSLLALLLALLGQSLFEPPPPPADSAQLGYVFFRGRIKFIGLGDLRGRVDSCSARANSRRHRPTYLSSTGIIH